MMLSIVGPMRSGTSVVARIAHQMGVSMGETMLMPPPGTGLDPEYEDVRLARSLLELDPTSDVIPTAFDAYIALRQRGAGKHWGFKSPALALFWEDWRDALERAGEARKVIVCERDPDDCLRSLVRSVPKRHLPWVLSIHDRIREALPDVTKYPHTVIRFGLPPEAKAVTIADVLQIADYDESVAVRGVR